VAAKGSASVNAALAAALGEPDGGPKAAETIDMLAVLLTATGILTGHMVMAAMGGVVLLAAGHACVQAFRTSRRSRREQEPSDE
jgi:hypothetical protein